MNTFESELSKTFRVREFHYFKRNIASTQEIPFLKPEGYDYTVLYQGQAYGIEAKMCSRSVTSIPFNRVADHQVEALLDCERCQGYGWILINFRKHPDKPKNISYGINEIMRLRPVNYKWKGTEQKDFGFLAQEVKLILPEIVYGEEGSMTISYSQITAVLTKAMQEQQKMIDELKNQNASLIQRLEAMEIAIKKNQPEEKTKITELKASK